MQEKASISKGWEYVESLDASQETPPKAVGRVNRSTGEKIKGEKFKNLSRTTKNSKVVDKSAAKYGCRSNKREELTDSMLYCIARYDAILYSREGML